MTIDDYSVLADYRTKMTELHDIAAMDRLAAELTPPSALRRWAEQRRATRSTRHGLRRLFGAARAHHA